MKKLTLGIDPGNTGALAWMLEESGEPDLFGVVDMPTVKISTGAGSKTKTKNMVSPTYVAQAISDLPHPPAHCFIEKVSSFSKGRGKDGAPVKQGTTSMFNFGRGLGILEGVLAARQIPVTFVLPQRWQAEMRVQGKSAGRERAGQLLPQYADLFKRVKDDGRADAALILLWGLKVTEEL